MIVEPSRSHPVMAALLAPLFRLQESSAGEKVLGLLTGLWTFVSGDLFIGLCFLLILSGTADTIYGRRVAIAFDKYDQTKAELGLQSKIMGLVMAVLIRLFEAWWASAASGGRLDGVHTYGYLAMAVAATLFVHDLKSIQEKRVRFGQPPLPVVSQVLAILDGLAAMLGGPPKGADIATRRESDPPRSSQYAKRRDPLEVHESIVISDEGWTRILEDEEPDG